MEQQDLFIKRIQDALDRYEYALPLEGDGASEEFQIGMELCDTIGNDEAKMQSLEDQVGFTLLDWMLELPFQLARDGLVDEAATLGARFSEITSPDNFLPDRAVILAEAGRKDEALVQLTESLLHFPDDPWVIIKSGDAYDMLEEQEKAERLYRQGLELAGEDQYTRLGALERLIPLLDDAGRSEEANALFEEENKRRKLAPNVWDSLLPETSSKRSITPLDDTAEELFLGKDDDDLLFTPHTRTLPKIGRNDPCLCGSGKKYKKCCLGGQHTSSEDSP